jgi:hypothetical protein
METVSENNRGRGRPRKYERDQHGYLPEFDRYESQPERGITEKYPSSRRQQQNVILAERARDFFTDAHFEADREDEDTDRYQFGLWLYMPEASHAGSYDIPQRVMTELGRLLSDGRSEDAWKAAAWFYRYRATPAARAQKIIRDFRLGKRDGLPEN